MHWKCVFILLVQLLHLTFAKYECHTVGNNISCTALIEENLYKPLKVTLTKEESDETEELNITDSLVISIKSDLFINFPNIQVLRLRNTSTSAVEKGAFRNLLNLKKVFLTHNYVKDIDSNVFSSNNSIHTIDISHNLLKDLDNFDINIFPSLTILNVSHNRLEYLPESILQKLKEQNNIYLIIDNNPWNCLHPKWVLYLSKMLVDAFCTNTAAYDSSESDTKLNKVVKVEYKNETKNEPENDTFDCMRYSLRSCLFWALAAVWIGIIIGNMCKLKRLLFTQPRRYEDKNTQCEIAWREPFMREDRSRADTQNKSPSKLNIPKLKNSI